MAHPQLGDEIERAFALVRRGDPMHIAQGGLDAAVAHQPLQTFDLESGRQLMGGIGVPLMPQAA